MKMLEKFARNHDANITTKVMRLIIVLPFGISISFLCDCPRDLFTKIEEPLG